MKFIFLLCLCLFSLAGLAQERGSCEIRAYDDSLNPFLTVIQSGTLSDCQKEFVRDIQYVKDCGVRFGGRVSHIEMKFIGAERTDIQTEEINILCE